MYLDNWNLLARGMVIMFLIVMFCWAIFIFKNIIKSSKDSICDSEKQSKFILECIKADTTKDLRAIGACEQMSLRLYCK
jgi:hypothetical protein